MIYMRRTAKFRRSFISLIVILVLIIANMSFAFAEDIGRPRTEEDYYTHGIVIIVFEPSVTDEKDVYEVADKYNLTVESLEFYTASDYPESYNIPADFQPCYIARCHIPEGMTEKETVEMIKMNRDSRVMWTDREWFALTDSLEGGETRINASVEYDYDWDNLVAGEDYVDGEMIVTFSLSVPDEDAMGEIVEKYGFSVKEVLSFTDKYASGKTALVSIDNGMTVREAIEVIEQDPMVRYAEPNLLWGTGEPEDPSDPEEIVNSGQCGDDLTWTLNTGGKLTISGTGPMWDRPFDDLSSNITSVYIEEGVTTVGTDAFAQRYELMRVKLPSTLTALEIGAFWDCNNLMEFNLPESLTSIGGDAFSGVNGIEYVILPSNLEFIGCGAFAYCRNLKQVTFTGDAPVIEENAFFSDKIVAYYDDYNDTWFENSGTENDVRQDYGGRICWACVMAKEGLLERMAGATRQETATAISKALFADGAENIIIASGDNYPDALAGGPLAYMLDAPILLVRRSQTDASTLSEIKRLGAKNAYILGGTGAVGDNVKDTLKGMGLNVERIYGADRFETAVAVAEKMDELRGGKPSVEFFVYAHNYPDALAISNVAAILESPILYIEKSGVMRDSIKKYMNSCGNTNFMIVIGGPTLINSNAETEMKKYGTVDRLYGSDRYETCIIIDTAFNDILNGDSLCLACGTNYPDALSGSVFAAFCHAPLMLVRGSDLTDLQKQYVYSKAPVNIFAFGGTGALSQSVLDEAKLYRLR